MCPNNNQEDQTEFFKKSIDAKENMTEMSELPFKKLLFKNPFKKRIFEAATIRCCNNQLQTCLKQVKE